MLPSLFFIVVFASQVLLISVAYPRRINALARGCVRADASSPDNERDGSSDAYARVNHFIGVLGLVLLPVIPWLAGSGRMTAALLSLGLFFLVQLSPLAFPRVRRLASRLNSARGDQEAGGADARRATKLLDAVGAAPVGIAALLAPSYLLLALTLWDGEADTQVIKMAVFTGTQLLFVGLISWSLMSLRRAPADRVEELYQNVRRLVPLMVFGSIMISVYYFGKEFLASFDGAQLRPTMMSLALQLVAVGVLQTLFFGRGQTRLDP